MVKRFAVSHILGLWGKRVDCLPQNDCSFLKLAFSNVEIAEFAQFPSRLQTRSALRKFGWRRECYLFFFYIISSWGEVVIRERNRRLCKLKCRSLRSKYRCTRNRLFR